MRAWLLIGPTITVARVPGPAAVSAFATPDRRLGDVGYGGGGAQGISPTPGALLPVTGSNTLPATATELTAATESGSGQLDAIQLTPLLSTLITDGAGHGVALLNSVADTVRNRTLTVPGTGPTTATSYDSQGQLWRTVTGTDSVTVTVPAGGFAVVQR